MNRIPSNIEDCSTHNYRKSGDVAIAEFKSHQAKPLTPTFLSEHTIIFLLKGSKVFYSGGEKEEVNENKVILLKRGYYLMCERLESMAYHSLAFCFNETLLHAFWSRYYKLLDLERPNYNNQVSVAELTPPLSDFKEILILYLNYNGRFLTHLLTNKFEEMLLNTLEQSPDSKLLNFISEICTSPKNQISYVVNTNLFNPVSIEDLAKLSGTSISSFKRKFVEIYGISPKKWIVTKKLEQANVLLHSNDKSVSEIAFECGFENISHFIKIYKNAFGVTPKAKMNQNSYLLN
jgi:AraC-like DNA-binding protein